MPCSFDNKTYQPPPELLRERVILVTGAGAGLGRAASRALAAHGATVILLGRTTEKLEATYDQIEAAGGPQPAIYPLNLEGASPKDYEDLARTLETEFGRLDGLLHNAAIQVPLSPFAQIDVGQWYQVMQVNLNAPFLLTQACLPLLRQAKDASLVFTGDPVGLQGRAYWGAYAAAKAGLQGMMEVLADETENEAGMRVNSIIPRPAATHLRAMAFQEEEPGRVHLPEDLMKTYLFLLGPDSAACHGQSLYAEPE